MARIRTNNSNQEDKGECEPPKNTTTPNFQVGGASRPEDNDGSGETPEREKAATMGTMGKRAALTSAVFTLHENQTFRLGMLRDFL
jgi:hypothetical protein